MPSELVEPPKFAIRTYESCKSISPPEPLLLNSFYLEDPVLFTEEALRDEEEDDAEIRMPSSRWRSRDRSRE